MSKKITKRKDRVPTREAKRFNNSDSKAGKFTLTVKTAGKVYTLHTDDIERAILDLGLTTTNTNTLITVSHEGKEVERLLRVAEARRVFQNRMATLIFAKGVRSRLNAV